MIAHEFQEYQSYFLPYEESLKSVMTILRQEYSNKIEIELVEAGWNLKSKGFVGYIPVTPDFALKINPKVLIANLLGMLEYTTKPNQLIRFFDASVKFQTLEEFYNTLAKILAQKIINRTKQGLYCTYLPHTQPLSYLKGRMDLKKAIQTPWNVKINCHYSEQTRDIADNQILAWTLHCISRTQFCNEQVCSLIRQAYHALQGYITLQPFTSQDCLDRQYNRLNEDYRSLHLLCRFFLDHICPSHELGSYHSYPFLIDMCHLYEQFVAEWLKKHLPNKYKIEVQKTKNYGQINLTYDLVLYDAVTEQPIYILDTKYKRIDGSKPNNSDIFQVVTYAVSQKCEKAILVYPMSLSTSFQETIEYIQVSSLSFALDGDLEQAGQKFLQDLLSLVTPQHRI